MQQLQLELKNVPGDASQVPCSTNFPLNRDTYITTEKTIVRDYGLLMVELQNHLNIAHILESLKPALLAKRPKRFRKLPWKIAVNRILVYVETHKHNFVDGGIRA